MIYIYKVETNELDVVGDVHMVEKKLLENGASKITDVKIMEDVNHSTGTKLSFIAFVYYEGTMEIEL